MKATFRIVLFSRTVADGRQPVMFRVTHSRKSRHFSLNRYALPDEWDEEKNRFRKTFPDAKRENELLRTLEQRAADIIFDWERSNTPFSFADFERLMFADRQGSAPVAWEYIAAIVDGLEKEGRIGTAGVYQVLARLLKAYSPAARLSDISAPWIEALAKWMLVNRNYKGSGVLHDLKTLRIVCNKAMKAGDMPEGWLPFKSANLAHLRSEVKHRAMTLEQLRTLKGATVESEFERFALDLFLFSFYCWGMNFSDIAALRRENIRELRIEYRRQKTKRMYSINLSPQAGAILDRYKSESPYLFPIYITGKHVTPKQKHVRKKNVRHDVNLALRDIVQRCGMEPKGFTLYVARHTYATALKRAGFAHGLIQDALGHADAKTTAVYLDRFENAALDSANAAILGEVG